MHWDRFLLSNNEGIESTEKGLFHLILKGLSALRQVWANSYWRDWVHWDKFEPSHSEGIECIETGLIKSFWWLTNKLISQKSWVFRGRSIVIKQKLLENTIKLKSPPLLTKPEQWNMLKTWRKSVSHTWLIIYHCSTFQLQFGRRRPCRRKPEFWMHRI